jgi:hypothetical protein
MRRYRAYAFTPGTSNLSGTSLPGKILIATNLRGQTIEFIAPPSRYDGTGPRVDCKFGWEMMTFMVQVSQTHEEGPRCEPKRKLVDYGSTNGSYDVLCL